MNVDVQCEKRGSDVPTRGSDVPTHGSDVPSHGSDVPRLGLMFPRVGLMFPRSNRNKRNFSKRGECGELQIVIIPFAA